MTTNSFSCKGSQGLLELGIWLLPGNNMVQSACIYHTANLIPHFRQTDKESTKFSVGSQLPLLMSHLQPGNFIKTGNEPIALWKDEIPYECTSALKCEWLQ